MSSWYTGDLGTINFPAYSVSLSALALMWTTGGAPDVEDYWWEQTLIHAAKNPYDATPQEISDFLTCNMLLRPELTDAEISFTIPKTSERAS